MKIIITVATYYPFVDGVQNVTQYQAEGLAKLGHDVTVITSNNHGKFKSEEIYNGVKILRINAYNKYTLHWGDKGEFQKLVLRCTKDANILINVCIQSFATDWVLPIIDKISCNKVLLLHSMHDFFWNKFDTDSWKTIVKKIAKNSRWKIFYKIFWSKIVQYDKVFHLHEKDYSLSFFKKRGYYNNVILYNAVEDIFFENSLKKRQQIICVGTYNKRKNQKKCMQLFYEANTRNYRLVIIGTPNNDYYQELMRYKSILEEEFGYKDVEVLCNISREKTIKYIAESQIFLMTSKWEAFPISIIEAIAAGNIYISSDVGVIKYIPGGVVCHSDKEFIGAIEKEVNFLDIPKIECGHAYAKQYCNRFTQIGKLEKELAEI